MPVHAPIVTRFLNRKCTEQILTRQKTAQKNEKRNFTDIFVTSQVGLPEERLKNRRSLTSQLSEIRKTVPATLATSTIKNNDIYINGGKINSTVQVPDLNNVFTSKKIDIPSATNEMNRALGHLCAHIG